jgi:hypothetical protein
VHVVYVRPHGNFAQLQLLLADVPPRLLRQRRRRFALIRVTSSPCIMQIGQVAPGRIWVIRAGSHSSPARHSLFKVGW